MAWLHTFHRVKAIRILLSNKIHFSYVPFAEQSKLDKAAGCHLNCLFLDRVGRVGSAECAYPPKVHCGAIGIEFGGRKVGRHFGDGRAAGHGGT